MRSGEIALERTDAGVTVVSITGEHDLSTAPELRRQLRKLVGEGSAIVVDLSKATFVDSSILGVILDARRRAADDGLGFAVAQANGGRAVARVLDVTGLREKLPVHSARADAEAAALSTGRAASR